MISTRRSFLTRLAAAAAVLGAFPQRIFAQRRSISVSASGSPDQDFWSELRSQFLMPADEAFFNTGTLGASPKSVLDAVVAHMTHVDRDIAHWDYKADHENYFTGYFPELGTREKIGRLINAPASQIALTQNATFGMNFVAHGLDLAPGEEVVINEAGHAGGRCGWELRARRSGTVVTYVKLPIPPKDPAQLIELYENATTARTRVWAIPHLTSAAAIRFPVEEMCRRARERGILSVVDGAQTCGHLRVDVQRMGCDAYFSSPHKWLLAPKGTGFLYVHEQLLPRLWATLASGEWQNYRDGAFRLMQYGTGNLSLLVGLEKAVEFHLAIGSARVEQRILGLADRLRAGLTRLENVTINSPLHPEMLSATTVWSISGMSGEALQDELWNAARVRVRSMGDLGVRQCCHIYNSEAEVDRTLAVARRIARA